MTIFSADEFIRLRYSDDPTDYERAAGEDAPIEVWRDIINYYPDARVWVAHNKTVPIEVLATLARDADPTVRHMVAMKRKLTPALLDHLAKDEDETIRLRVAMHKNTSRATLEILKGDSWSRVREVVGKRIDC